MFMVLYYLLWMWLSFCPFLTPAVSQPWGPYAYLVGFWHFFFFPELLLQQFLWEQKWMEETCVQRGHAPIASSFYPILAIRNRPPSAHFFSRWWDRSSQHSAKWSLILSLTPSVIPVLNIYCEPTMSRYSCLCRVTVTNKGDKNPCSHGAYILVEGNKQSSG